MVKSLLSLFNRDGYQSVHVCVSLCDSVANSDLSPVAPGDGTGASVRVRRRLTLRLEIQHQSLNLRLGMFEIHQQANLYTRALQVV